MNFDGEDVQNLTWFRPCPFEAIKTSSDVVVFPQTGF
jgi:hypothetical protein